MANYAVIQGNVVVNIINAPTRDIAEEATGMTCVEYDPETDRVKIGNTWNGTEFVSLEIKPTEIKFEQPTGPII